MARIENRGHEHRGVPLLYARTEGQSQGRIRRGVTLMNGIGADSQYHLHRPTPVLGVYSRSGYKMLKLLAQLPHLKGIVTADNRLRAFAIRDNVTFNVSLN